MLKVGIIGFGGRVQGFMKELCSYGETKITAIADIDPEGVKKRALESKFTGYEDYKFYSDAEEMLKNEQLDGVIIGTRCNKHTDYALLVAKYNIPMFLEKPVATTQEDVERLRTIMHMNDKTVVSFPLRIMPVLQRAKEIIDSGKLGKISQIQAYNNVPYGRVYFKYWYRDEATTGGMFLQKATHDFDYIRYLLDGKKPVRICAMTSKQIFKGDMPANLKCCDCPKKDTCIESVEVIRKSGVQESETFDMCCFAVDTGNEDSGSALIEFEDGMHVSYTQNFVVRRNEPAGRGAKIVGFLATMELDLYWSKIHVYHHHTSVNETYDVIPVAGGHGGGDYALAKSFIEVMKGEAKSMAPLIEGIESANLCLKAKISAQEHKFMDI